MPEQDLHEDLQAALARLAEESNEKLEQAAAAATNHAFNLGCSLSLVPGAVILILVVVLTRFNWVAAGLTAALLVLAGLGAASLLAFTARKRSTQQEYKLRIGPEIERQLRSMPASREVFETAARQALPGNAPLRAQLVEEGEDSDPSSNSN